MANPKALIQGGGALIDLFQNVLKAKQAEKAAGAVPKGSLSPVGGFTPPPPIKANPLDEFTDATNYDIGREARAAALREQTSQTPRSADSPNGAFAESPFDSAPSRDQIIQTKQDEAIDAVAGQIPLSRQEINEMVEYHGYTPEELANMTPTEISDRLRAGSEYRQSDMSSDEWAMHTSEEAILTKMLQQLRGRHPSESRPINNPFEDESAVFDGTDYNDIPF